MDELREIIAHKLKIMAQYHNWQEMSPAEQEQLIDELLI